MALFLISFHHIFCSAITHFALSMLLRTTKLCRLPLFRGCRTLSTQNVGLPENDFKTLEASLKNFMETEIYPNEKLFEKQSKEIEEVNIWQSYISNKAYFFNITLTGNYTILIKTKQFIAREWMVWTVYSERTQSESEKGKLVEVSYLQSNFLLLTRT